MKGIHGKIPRGPKGEAEETESLHCLSPDGSVRLSERCLAVHRAALPANHNFPADYRDNGHFSACTGAKISRFGEETRRQDGSTSVTNFSVGGLFGGLPRRRQATIFRYDDTKR